MKVQIIVNDVLLTVKMADNNTAKDFMKLLPLKLTLEDYAKTEKISYLPRKLSTEGSPKGSKPSIGDITYYAPWGNLAIFYRNHGYANGLIPLGTIEGEIDIFKTNETLDVEIILHQ